MSQSQMTIHKTFYLLKILHASVTKYIKIDINSGNRLLKFKKE